MRHYITTAIDFPNAAPHMGHVLEKILADTLARYYRTQGHEVRFHIGNDENGIKIEQTAKALGITPRALVDKHAPIFKDLFTRLNISFDFFIRTANEELHWPTVRILWKKLQAAGMLEKRTYTGLYCNGCERFLREVDMVDGVCPDHKKPPETVREENWFFLLSKMQSYVAEILHPDTGSYHIIPSWRANETLSFLAEGLEDISFSRSIKTLTWGVPVPDDEEQIMYVWCDNLTSYISSLGFFLENEASEWWNDATVTHVIGKDIARFHAINWPAMLHAAGVKAPDRLLIHGFLTSEGQKMSKSLGNVVSPEEILADYPPDVLRFYVLYEVPVGNDGDFSWGRFKEMYNSILRNKLGNLLNRTLVLLQKEGGVFTSAPDTIMAPPYAAYTAHMEAFEFSKALHSIVEYIDYLNQHFDQAKPWTLPKEEKIAVLQSVCEALRHVSLLLLPFIPKTAQEISLQLGVPYATHMQDCSFVVSKELQQWSACADWMSVSTPSILFPVVEGA